MSDNDDKQQALQQQLDQILEMERLLSHRTLLLDQSSKELDSYQESLDVRSTALNNFESALNEREQALDSFEDALDQRQLALDNLHDSLENQQRALDTYSNVLDDLSAEQDQLQTELNIFRQVIDEKTAEIMEDLFVHLVEFVQNNSGLVAKSTNPKQILNNKETDGPE